VALTSVGEINEVVRPVLTVEVPISNREDVALPSPLTIETEAVDVAANGLATAKAVEDAVLQVPIVGTVWKAVPPGVLLLRNQPVSISREVTFVIPTAAPSFFTA
jgi:hypothetical protein